MVWNPPADLRVDVFYYDGDHSSEATEQALRKFVPLLRPTVLLIDDWNSEEVRVGTMAAQLPITKNYIAYEEWNGFNVSIIDVNLLQAQEKS